MMIDKMNKLEKIALTSAVSGAVFNVFLYGIGATLATATTGNLFYARVIAAILQAAAFDLVAIATVMGMRTGRRGAWSMATAAASALVSAAIALDVAGVLSMPWLHAANALIVLAFTLHLLTPRKSTRASELRRLVGRLVARLRQERQVSEYNLATLRQAATDRDKLVASLQAELTAARQELTRRPPPVTIEVVRVARFELTWDEIEVALTELKRRNAFSLSSFRREVARLAAPVTEEA
jgi:pimeloyl-ACP methyl ester carboxylesterase